MGGAYRTRRLRAAGLAAALAVAGAAAAAPDAAQLCRRFPITDARNGRAIKGPEDIVFDAANDRFLVAAFDRDQVEPDAQGRWSGGVFVLPRAALAAGGATLSRLPGSAPDLRPHGIAIGSDGAVWAVHRAPDGPANARSEVRRIAADGMTRWADEALCRANDLAIAPDGARALVTLDRGACGGGGKVMEEVFGLERGGVAALSIDTPGRVLRIADDMDIPNGVVIIPPSVGGADAWAGAAIAETRSMRVQWLKWRPRGDTACCLSLLTTPLPGGPDNLNPLGDGGDRILVTAHDGLMRLFAHMNVPGWFDPPGSAVYILESPDGNGATVEPVLGLAIPGDLYAGATAAAYDGDGRLVVGAAVETGLLVCDWTPPPAR